MLQKYHDHSFELSTIEEFSRGYYMIIHALASDVQLRSAHSLIQEAHLVNKKHGSHV